MTVKRLAAAGDVVRIRYTVKTQDGLVLDDCGGQLLEFTVGEDATMPALDAGVVGMAVGETRRIVVSSEAAYGPYEPGLVLRTHVADLMLSSPPEVGGEVALPQPDGEVWRGRVLAVDGEAVTLDANFAGAGLDVVVTIDLEAIASET